MSFDAAVDVTGAVCCHTQNVALVGLTGAIWRVSLHKWTLWIVASSVPENLTPVTPSLVVSTGAVSFRHRDHSRSFVNVSLLSFWLRSLTALRVPKHQIIRCCVGSAQTKVHPSDLRL
jgi:hypothetical protein